MKIFPFGNILRLKSWDSLYTFRLGISKKCLLRKNSRQDISLRLTNSIPALGTAVFYIPFIHSVSNPGGKLCLEKPLTRLFPQASKLHSHTWRRKITSPPVNSHTHVFRAIQTAGETHTEHTAKVIYMPVKYSMYKPASISR